MTNRYPHLGAFYDVYQSYRIKKAREKLLGTLWELFCARFIGPYSVWRSDIGRLYMSLGKPHPVETKIPMVEVLSERPAPSQKDEFLLKRNKNFIPYFPVIINGAEMYVNFKLGHLLPLDALKDFICHLNGKLPPKSVLEYAKHRIYFRYLLKLSKN